VWSEIDTLTFDCTDPVRLSEFWAQTVGFKVVDTLDEGGNTEVLMAGQGDMSLRLIFIRVPEAKAVKNRLHLDLTPPRTRDEEIERLRGLGATVVEGFGGPEATWVVMRDPAGNEFCVLQGPDDATKPQVGQNQSVAEGGDA